MLWVSRLKGTTNEISWHQVDVEGVVIIERNQGLIGDLEDLDTLGYPSKQEYWQVLNPRIPRPNGISKIGNKLRAGVGSDLTRRLGRGWPYR